MCLKTTGSSKKKKNKRYAITNFSLKDISNIIKELEKFPYEGYVRNRPKHEPTENYFYLERQLDKCMMRADTFNSHVYPVRNQMTSPQ